MTNMLTRVRCLGMSVILLALLLAPEAGHTTGLSDELSVADIKESALVLGLNSMHRPWTAHAITGEGIGLGLGVETTFMLRHDLLSHGDGSAVIPRVVPVPRLWMSWELPLDLYISGSWAPGKLFDGVEAYGGAVQWAFFEDDESQVAASALVHFTYADAFGDLTTKTMGAALQLSKDMTLWQPYVGLGAVVGNSSVRKALAANSDQSGPFTTPATHAYVGVRLDLMAKLAFQADLIGLKPGLSVLLSGHY